VRTHLEFESKFVNSIEALLLDSHDISASLIISVIELIYHLSMHFALVEEMVLIEGSVPLNVQTVGLFAEVVITLLERGT